MSSDLRLVIFDVDGTLVDSQSDILAAFAQAFAHAGRTLPAPAQIMSIVGLSLDVAIARLVPDICDADGAAMVEAYKDAYVTLRASTPAQQSSPFYPGVHEGLTLLKAIPEMLLGVATGKSKRGLDKLIEAHGLEGMFVTRQVADFHPSKPHPSMILQAMADTGVGPSQTVMVGDTSYDMDMAAAAGVAGIGVSWGYHTRDALTAARHIIDRFDELPAVLRKIWSV
ncbi:MULTISPECIES: HAD-IA family hydrolase [unclassified Sulfitobacter]|uniref:HAD-IA family hydrolase n=1 Tax=unclassified Sulfitobacter TaxID=196795 RepID=UPI00159453B6|nr:HAD-IA family hydrolase [Sulfitobacter sp. HGT1]